MSFLFQTDPDLRMDIVRAVSKMFAGTDAVYDNDAAERMCYTLYAFVKAGEAIEEGKDKATPFVDPFIADGEEG